SDAALWRQKAETLARRMLEDFWDEESGRFHFLRDEQPIPVRTPFHLLPLWTGSLPPRVTGRLLEHFVNPREFFGETALPTVARDDPAYDPDTMWRGPAWANVNYFFIEALRRIGRNDLARQLRDKTLNMIMSQPSIYEYYNSETGQPGARAVPAFGWSAAVFIDLAIQASAES
ncbi:MAG: trehalase family glycosidase, partial [Chloroflexota bacterium]